MNDMSAIAVKRVSTSQMIERIAPELHRSTTRQSHRYFGDLSGWADLTPRQQQVWRDRACVAIQMLRDNATQGMWDAAWDQRHIKNTWYAMLDAALQDPEPSSYYRAPSQPDRKYLKERLAELRKEHGV